MLVTVSTSRVRKKSITVRNFSCPAVVVPDRFSARITSHVAGRYFDSCCVATSARPCAGGNRLRQY
jgi:hypothetical protein